MLAPDGYALEKCLHTSERSVVYAAVRESDKRPVVLKTYVGDDADARARHEHEVVRAIQGKGVAAPLALQMDELSPILVLERIPGVPLLSWVAAELPGSAAVLDVVIQLCETLGRIHEARLLHRDIQPQNILVDPATHLTHLVSFDLVQPLGTAEPGSANFLGLPRYVAPEQTGRMGRGIDFRSDLYAVGATLYFALTGEPPFPGDDPLALIHAHMARRPVPPIERRTDVAPTLSRIVVKLLQKEPEDRYQTARALECDLHECREQLRRTGRIDDAFPLGTADAPFRPLFTNRLYGRDTEIAALHGAYDRARQGRPELVILSGAPGAGKSRLVHELRRALPETRGYLAVGKYDLYRRDVPYSGLLAAFESLVDQILAESEAQVSQWRERLNHHLGNVAPALIELLPQLAWLLGDLGPAQRLGPKETQARLAIAVQRFMKGCASKDHPLVLFLDDLQWADPGSRELLEALLRGGENTALLVLGAYRSNEVDGSHPLHALLERLADARIQVTQIVLTPLTLDAATQMLADVLGRPLSDVRTLSERIERKTGSNPLLIQQFVLHLHGLGLIRYQHPSGWTWDEAAIAAANIPDGAVALMVAKLERLAPEPRRLIQFASCVADEFAIEWLLELSGQPREAIEPPLFVLTEEGLLAPSPRGFRFVHDRVREAAQELLSSEERQALHHRMGRLLLAHTPSAALAERAFEIADHLNRAVGVLSEEDRQQAVAINFSAGRRALASGAATTAAAYLSFGRALFRDADAERDPALGFNLFAEATEAAYQTRELALVFQLCDVLDRRPLDPQQRLKVAGARIRALVVSGPERMDEALERTLAELRRHGLRWPKQPSWLRVRLAIFRTDLLLRRCADQPSAERPRLDLRMASLALVGDGGVALQLTGPGLMAVALSHIVGAYFQDGVFRGSALTLGAYATYRMRVWPDLAAHSRYARLVESWFNRQPVARAHLHLRAFLLGWFVPRRKTVEALLRGATALAEVGDIEYCGYVIREAFAYLVNSGEQLDACMQWRDMAEHREGIGAEALSPIYRTIYGTLQRDTKERLDWDHELGALSDVNLRSVFSDLHRAHWTCILCVMGEYERTAVQAERAIRYVRENGAPVAYFCDFFMFCGVAEAAVAARTRGSARRHARQVFRACWRQLSKWARHAPDAVHMQELLEAERARLRGKHAAALRIYQSAAQRARKGGFRHHAALAHERRASLLQDLRRWSESALALGQAFELYREWGATLKVRQLEAAAEASGEPFPGLKSRIS